MHRSQARKALIISTALLAALAPALLLAAPHRDRYGRPAGPGGPGGPPPGLGMMADHLAEELDLTQEQRDAIREVIQARHDEMADALERSFAAREALRQQIHAETFDEGAIRQAAAEVAAVEEEMAISRGLAFQEIQKILTPEQRAQARQLMEEHRERFAERRERWHHFGPPPAD